MITKYIGQSFEKKLLIPIYLMDNICSIAKKHLPNEFGGIITGIRGEVCDIVVDFEIPNSFKQSKTSFTRSTENLNEYLEDIYTDTAGTLQYLGEWHTHPNGTAEYSNKDYTSMHEIAADPNTKFKTPYLIIISVTHTSCSHSVFRTNPNTLVKLNKV